MYRGSMQASSVPSQAHVLKPPVLRLLLRRSPLVSERLLKGLTYQKRQLQQVDKLRYSKRKRQAMKQ